MATAIYDSTNVYDDSALTYDGGGGGSSTVTAQAEWLKVLNTLAGTKNLGENEAANIYAYGSDHGNGLLKALNDKAGTKNLGLNAVCNSIAGTTGLSALGALNQKAGL